MPTEAKLRTVDELRVKFSTAQSVIFAEYSGLNAFEIGELRRQLRDASSELCVVKNTLARRAAKGTPLESAVAYFRGSSSVVLNYTDSTDPMKVMVKSAKDLEKLNLKGGLITGKVLSAEEVKKVSELPSKEVLIAQLLATMNAPATNFVGVLSGVIRKLLYALKAIEQKKQS